MVSSLSCSSARTQHNASDWESFCVDGICCFGSTGGVQLEEERRWNLICGEVTGREAVVVEPLRAVKPGPCRDLACGGDRVSLPRNGLMNFPARDETSEQSSSAVREELIRLNTSLRMPQNSSRRDPGEGILSKEPPCVKEDEIDNE